MKKISILYIVLFGWLTSFAQTANWSPVAPNFFPTNVSGQIHGISRVSQMKFHPTNSSKLYAVSARGGLFISSNGGTSWTIAVGCDSLPQMSLASVCIDFINDQILYLGTGDHNYYGGGSGVYKSTNGGATFSPTTLTGKLVVDMIMDPLNNQVVVAVTNAGIYKTTNGGTSWTLKSTSRTFDDIKQKSATSRVLYAATTDTGFFRSADFGDTWAQINSGLVLPVGVTNGGGCRIAVTPADTNIIYFGMVGNGGMLYKSTNGGNSFTAIKTASPPYLTYYTNDPADVGQGDYNFGIGVDRTNANIIYMVAHAVWKSTDGGVNWTQKTNWWQSVHTDMHQIITSPYNNAQLWDINDGGVWLSTDGGTTWNPKSDGIYGYEIYHGKCSPTRKDMISIGTQDNGELYYLNSGTSWFCNRGGDWGSKCAFDFFPNSQRVYYYGNARRRNVTGSEATFGLPRSSFRSIAFHRNYTNLAFVGDSNIYRTTNLSAASPTWTQIGNINKRIVALHVAQGDSNRVYAITSDQNIYVSTNALSASPTFTQYALPFAVNNAASVVAIKNNPAIVYAIMNTRVYRSANSGQTWTDVTFNLPSVNYVDIITDDFNPTNELMIVAGNNTVYFKLGSHTSWTLFKTNLPQRTTINDMSIFDDGTPNSSLRVSTYGRGMWETPITSIRALNAAFTVTTNTPCPGVPVQFNDISTGNPVTWSWSFPGGTPSTSTIQNPVVTYNSSGTYNVSLTVTSGASNSSLTKNNYIVTAGQTIPLTETFESTFPPNGWTIVDGGADGKNWAQSTAASGFGIGSASLFYDNYNLNSGGNRDEIRTMRYDLTGYANFKLKFDVAYQLFSNSPTYLDSLSVLISTNCGSSFSTIYVKPGSSLATVPGTGGSFTPTPAQWRTDSIDLSSYFGQSILLSFMNHGHFGNNIYIDNVNLGGSNPFVTLNLKLFLEGYYDATSNTMTPAVDPVNQPTAGDTVDVKLAASTSPYSFIYSDRKVVATNGTVKVTFPLAALNNSYYVVVRHRNTLETWSKNPVTFNLPVKTFDFTIP
ncbi:MAG: PKD domain-containing protein [Bacteroidota bacterium]